MGSHPQYLPHASFAHIAPATTVIVQKTNPKPANLWKVSHQTNLAPLHPFVYI